jgi:hypothetical protein
MGGNALKKCITRRYSHKEYVALASLITYQLKNLFPDCRFEIIKAYHEKESFGDMDIIIDSTNLPVDWVEQVVQEFEPAETYKNSNVLSFEHREFQIDLIVTPACKYQTSLDYFAYNDLGNLLGRVAYRMGLKLGHDGLSYNWRDGTHLYKSAVLLTDWKDILPVLGYDYEIYAQGFDTLEDIFKFVVTSPYFCKDIFMLHNRNHISRIRDMKRKTYMEFLKWLETYEDTAVQKINAGWVERNKNTVGKNCWLPQLFATIPGFKSVYEQVEKEYQQHLLFKARYNGDLISVWTGFKGKELGHFMRWINEKYGGKEKVKRDILKLNPVLIERWVMHWKFLYYTEVKLNGLGTEVRD